LTSSTTRTSPQQQPHRWRAGYTLAVLDRILDPNGHGRTRTHHRAPINDDEIVTRAIATRRALGRHINFVTHDTAQALRERNAGLDVTKLRIDPGPEPTA